MLRQSNIATVVLVALCWAILPTESFGGLRHIRRRCHCQYNALVAHTTAKQQLEIIKVEEAERLIDRTNIDPAEQGHDWRVIEAYWEPLEYWEFRWRPLFNRKPAVPISEISVYYAATQDGELQRIAHSRGLPYAIGQIPRDQQPGTFFYIQVRVRLEDGTVVVH